MADSVVDTTSSIAAFLDAAGGKATVRPAGEASARFVGALAASMGEMVVNYSIGKKDLAPHEPALRDALAELGRASECSWS